MIEDNKKLILEIDSILNQEYSENSFYKKIRNKLVATSIKNSIYLGYNVNIFYISDINAVNKDSNTNELIAKSAAKAWLMDNNIEYDELIIGWPGAGYNCITLEEFIFKFSGPYWKKTVDVVIPFFNEEGNVSISHHEHKNIERFFNVNKYIYIDNGSSDNTFKNLKEISYQDKKIEIISIKNNLGYGYGIKQGLKYSDSDLILLNHADLQFNPHYFFQENLTSLIKLTEPLYILPQRFNRPIIDRISSSFLRLLLSIVYIDKLPDFNGQPKLFSTKNIKNINELPDNFCIDLALSRMCKDHSIILPTTQSDRYSGKSSWNEDFVKRITIFLEYLFYAIKERKSRVSVFFKKL